MPKHERKDQEPEGFPVGEAKTDPNARDGSRKTPGKHATDNPRNTKSDK